MLCMVLLDDTPLDDVREFVFVVAAAAAAAVADAVVAGRTGIGLAVHSISIGVDVSLTGLLPDIGEVAGRR